DYWVRNDEGGPNGSWDTNSSIAVFREQASSTNRRGEGNHYHSAGSLTAESAGLHFHSVTIPELSHTGSQTLDNMPPYTNLLKICRVR
ncbi:MAG: hypothetical protein AAF633_14660, partial [Chloroflexota bacterium]